MIISTTHIVKVILDILNNSSFLFFFFFKRIIISRLQFLQQNLILHFLINLLIFLVSFSKAVKSRQLREILVPFSNRNLITRSRSLQDFFHFRWKSDGVWKVISYQLPPGYHQLDDIFRINTSLSRLKSPRPLWFIARARLWSINRDRGLKLSREIAKRFFFFFFFSSWLNRSNFRSLFVS